VTLATRLLDFIRSDLLRNPGAELTADESLLELGVVDSMGLIRLVGFIEQETGKRIPDHAVTPANFQSVRRIVELLERGELSGTGGPPS
jgi:acyl carrier protein